MYRGTTVNGPGGPFKNTDLIVWTGLKEDIEITAGVMSTLTDEAKLNTLTVSADLVRDEQPSLHLTGSALEVLSQQ